MWDSYYIMQVLLHNDLTTYYCTVENDCYKLLTAQGIYSWEIIGKKVAKKHPEGWIQLSAYAVSLGKLNAPLFLYCFKFHTAYIKTV